MVSLFDQITALRTAPPGKFKVVELDSWAPPSEAATEIAIVDTLEEALSIASKGGEDYVVYNDKGEVVDQLEADQPLQKAAPKFTKVLGGYVGETPEERNPTCDTCRWFIKEESKCSILVPSEVHPKGCCDFWNEEDPLARLRQKATYYDRGDGVFDVPEDLWKMVPITLEKHLPGRHDQKDHGSPGGGSYALTRDQESIVRDYAEGYFQDLNTALRQGTVVNRRMEQEIQDLDNAILQGDVNVQDTELWRVIVRPKNVFGSANLQDLVGHTFKDAGYASFSTEFNPEMVEMLKEVHENKEYVVLRTIGSDEPLHGLNVGDLARWYGEQEVLMPRDLKYTIREVRTEEGPSGEPMTVLDVTLRHDD